MYRDFWQLFVKGYGRLRMALLICALTIAVSLLEAFNIGLLIPLLEILESPGQEGGHWISQAFANLFDALGLTFKLGTILLALAILVLGTSGLKYLRMILVGKTAIGFVAWMRSRTMGNLLYADMSYFHRERLGILTGMLTTQSSRAGGTFQEITEMVASLGIIGAYLTAAFLIAPALTGVAFATLLIVSLAMQYYISRAKTMGARLVQRENELQAAAVESLSGIRVVKSFLLERLRWMDFSSKTEEVGETSYHLTKNQSQMLILQEAVLFALIGGIVFVGISVLDLGIAVVVALLFILYRLTPRITSLNARRQALAATLPALRSVKMVMDEAAAPKVISGGKPFVKLHTGIELKEVSFSYDGDTKVLQDTDFTIEKGRMTAIVGTSGAGKSTIMDLILRYYDPEQGSVLVDGVDLRELDLTSWRNSIGVVSQDVFLFNDTIANNIALGRPEVTRESIMEAARQAYADDFIQQLPQGYETQVGDRGWNLSGGQRQRIALARAILKMPEILILDEATSSLDSESEQLIQEYMRKIRGTCTMVVVAHRMSTIQDADKIAVLQDGKIAEEGDWDSLLAGAGVFASYHRIQSGI